MKNTESEDFNQRQLKIMADELNEFKCQKISLKYLIKRLKEIFRIIESMDKEWSESFLREWGTLETVYAIFLDQREQGILSGKKAEESINAREISILESVEKLEFLVQTKLEHRV